LVLLEWEYYVKFYINVLSGISGLGIETSGIKHIASNYKNNDLVVLRRLATIVKKLAVFTGILGCLLTIFLSTWLSQLTLEIQIIAFIYFYFCYVIVQAVDGRSWLFCKV
jgi:O-antigen/teichoic acid export membrane protein